MALGIAFGKIAISILSAFAIVYFRFPFRKTAFWMIFVTLMLPVEVRIIRPTRWSPTCGMLNTYAGLTLPLIASATGDVPVPPVLPDRARRAARGRAHRRRRPDALLLGHGAAAVEDHASRRCS